tara:strand:- start:1837 stop:2334 length:498 start_codon:yes stop_codon:yes gene_type:complete
MNKKSINIDFEYDYDFLLIGICSPLKDYTLSYHLNKALQASLKRSKNDVVMSFQDGIEEANFSQFEFWNDQFQNQWYLIANSCVILCSDSQQNQGTIFDGYIQNRKKTKKLIPENPNVDYFLQIHGIFNQTSKLSLLKTIKNLDRIVSAHVIDIADLKSKENLII